MKAIDSNLSTEIIKTTQTNLGDLHFFNHMVIVEFYDGVHVDIDSSENLIDEVIMHFGTHRSFGIVANRINSYSISIMDMGLFNMKLENLKAYGVIGYSTAGKMNAEIENSFCKSEKINYTSIYEAMDCVFDRVKKSIQVSLN